MTIQLCINWVTLTFFYVHRKRSKSPSNFHQPKKPHIDIRVLPLKKIHISLSLTMKKFFIFLFLIPCATKWKIDDGKWNWELSESLKSFFKFHFSLSQNFIYFLTLTRSTFSLSFRIKFHFSFWFTFVMREFHLLMLVWHNLSKWERKWGRKILLVWTWKVFFFLFAEGFSAVTLNVDGKRKILSKEITLGIGKKGFDDN